MNTYIILLDGQYRAVGMDMTGTVVYSLDTSACHPGVRSVYDRNDAIRAVSRPHTWRDAIDIATRSGHYIGQLYAGAHHPVRER